MKTSSQEKFHEGGHDEIVWQHIKEPEEEHFWLRKKAQERAAKSKTKQSILLWDLRIICAIYNVNK